MRRLAVLAIVLGCGGAGAAGAQTVAPQASSQTLARAAFAVRPEAPDDAIGRLLDRQTLSRVDAATSFSSGEVRLPHSGHSVDTLRVDVVSSQRSPAGLPLDLSQPGRDEAYEVSLVRNWPAAVSFQTDRFGVDLSPHAGVGVGSYGGSAEAGATLQLSQRVDQVAANRLRAMGVRDGATLGDRGRWYLFAAASGRAVGWNMLHGDTGWDRAGWTTDPSSTLIGDAQVGVGWRKGAMQTSLGLIHREIKGLHMLYGQDTKDDSLVAFSFSVKPKR